VVYTFQQLFSVSASQQLMDNFARASGIGVVIAAPDGPPITVPSISSPLCKLIMSTQAGRRNCARFIAFLSHGRERRPELRSCMAGLHTWTTSIMVEGRHIASLLVGQVLNTEQEIGPTLDYCKSLGIDEHASREAFNGTIKMTKSRFTYLCEFIHQSGSLLSNLLLQNLRQCETIRKNTEIEALLAKEKEFFQTTINSIGDAVITMNMDGIVMTMNGAAEVLTGFMRQDAIHRPFSQTFVLLHEKTRKRFNCSVKGRLEKSSSVASETYLLQAGDGSEKHIAFNCSPIQDTNGHRLGAVLVCRDISASKKQTEKMEYLSYHDSLTGLYNRAFFEQACDSMQQKGIVPVSVIMGDANGLKNTNDFYGHAAGDILLKTIADAFKHACRSDDIVARWGGDEFTAALPGLTNRRAKAIMRDIHTYCAAAQGSQIKISVALGLATKESPETTLSDVLNIAEKKMYRAKRRYKLRNLARAFYI